MRDRAPADYQPLPHVMAPDPEPTAKQPTRHTATAAKPVVLPIADVSHVLYSTVDP